MYTPSYILAYLNGNLKRYIEKLWNILSRCRLCPRLCNVDRIDGKKGGCGADAQLKIYTYMLHTGEEPPISSGKGSGTIFFSHCPGKCVYCQNYPFSQLGKGKVISIEELAKIMLALQEKGACNINLVTPTHFLPHICSSLLIAVENGLKIPIVYNTNGYELPETLEILKDLVDIYLVDMRYSREESGLKYSSLPDYVRINRIAVKIMYEQKGDLIIEDGIGKKGIIIRMLILPGLLKEIKENIQFIRTNISPELHLSILAQYRPLYRAFQYPPLNRYITEEEYSLVIDFAYKNGFLNSWCQIFEEVRTDKRYIGANFSEI